MFNYASRHRHLPPYAENPFARLGIERAAVEDAKPIRLLMPGEEKRFLEACDDWQFPVFLTLMMTGLRAGELTHLMLPDDLDLEAGVLRVRNKPELGWQVKTRSERELPLHPVLVEALRGVVGQRRHGLVFRARMRSLGDTGAAEVLLERILREMASRIENELGRALTREERMRAAGRAWVRAGIITNERLRREFMRLTRKIGLPDVTTPKTLRHMFATGLQEADVDPLIRMELMGHSPTGAKASGPLGMTAVYTHTKPETRRRQLLAALERRPCSQAARDRLWRDGTAARAG
jgi:integrase